MRVSALSIKSRLSGSGGTASGVLGGIGSIHNVCHSICLTIVSILAIFGISTSILPLMFLQTYQIYFWLMALVFTAASFYFYQKQINKSVRDRNLLFINFGLLIFGLPISQLSILSFLTDYMDFFRFVGGSLAVMGLLLLLFGKKLKNIVYSPEELEEVSLGSSAQNLRSNEVMAATVSTVQLPKLSVSSVFFAIIIGGFLFNQYYIYHMGIFNNMGASVASTTTPAMKSQMKFTNFDVALAKERMDKNNDGVCDTCGMSIQQCIDSGQLDCNMGNSNTNAIGVLGSQHIHADWKIYIDGKPFDWTPFANLHERQMQGDTSVTNTSAFIHIHPVQAPEKGGDILHMHATKVPLSLFFRSLGMNLTKDSLILADGQVLKNENGNTLKFYLNGHKVDELGDYAFQPLDKLLISFGPENDPDIERQINSVTNFAKNH